MGRRAVTSKGAGVQRDREGRTGVCRTRRTLYAPDQETLFMNQCIQCCLQAPWARWRARCAPRDGGGGGQDGMGS